MLYGDGLEPYGFSFSTEVKISPTQCGNKRESFLRDTIAPMITPDTKVYQELENSIFK